MSRQAVAEESVLAAIKDGKLSELTPADLTQGQDLTVQDIQFALHALQNEGIVRRRGAGLLDFEVCPPEIAD